MSQTKTFAPHAADQIAAQKLADLLQNSLPETLHLSVQSPEKGGGETVPTEIAVSGEALRLFVQVLDERGKGNAVAVLPCEAELSPQQAAAYLGMSRTLLTRLLNSGEIPYHYVGTHKRIALTDLIAFCAERERGYEAMRELIAETEALGLYK